MDLITASKVLVLSIPIIIITVGLLALYLHNNI